MIYTDNRQEKLNVDEEFINSLEKVCDFVLKKFHQICNPYKHL